MKKIGFWTALSLVVGNIIGVGIFTTTGYTAARISDPKLILWVWTAGALYALSGAVVYGFLSKKMPFSGGDYRYLKEYLPAYFPFLFGWSGLFITYTGSIAALALGAASYLNILAPALHLSAAFLFTDGMTLSAIFLVFIFTVINVLGIQSGGKTQLALTLLIFLLMLGFIVAGYFSGARHLLPAAGSAHAGEFAPFFSALAAVLFTYMGWTTVVYIAEEVQNPKKNIPLALGVGVLLTALLYMGINFIFLSVLSTSEAAGQINVAALTAQRLWGGGAAVISSGMILIAILSSLNSTILSGPRIYQVMAADGFLWKRLKTEHKKYKTPSAALWVQGGWAVLLLLSGTFDQLLTMVVAVILVFSILSAGIAVKILWNSKQRYGVLLWSAIIIYLAMCLLILITILRTQLWATVSGILILSPSLPVYLWQRKRSA